MHKAVCWTVCGALRISIYDLQWRRKISIISEEVRRALALSLRLFTLTHNFMQFSHSLRISQRSILIFSFCFLLLSGPFLVIYTMSWIVDLYSAGLQARLITPWSLINSVQCPCPALHSATSLLSLQTQPLKIRFTFCLCSLAGSNEFTSNPTRYVVTIQKKCLQFTTGGRDPLRLLSGLAQIDVNCTLEITGPMGVRGQS